MARLGPQGQTAWLCRVPAVGPWLCHLPALCADVLIINRNITVVSTSWHSCKVYIVSTCEAHDTDSQWSLPHGVPVRFTELVYVKHTILSGKHLKKLLINISKFTLAVSSGKFCRFIEFLCVAVSFMK